MSKALVKLRQTCPGCSMLPHEPMVILHHHLKHTCARAHTHRQRLVLLVTALSKTKGHFLGWQGTPELCNYSQPSPRKRPKD